MTGFLLDTNVPSEMTRPHPQQSVTAWLDEADDAQLYLSVISLGEISKGIATLSEGRRRQELQEWLDRKLRPWFQGRILPISEAIAERWGLIAAQSKLKGHPLKVEDGLSAATALEHGLALVTRNVRDFGNLGVTIVDPWN
jgi:predicted nucleic acid-binding protein